ncbi:hypothetical protein BHU72_03565 [Desulfuribacillus stibiiarsenatis]|uniref:PRC-barrel domain-containing protein n=1 Tax=Desulfuribacillus stibiiarsenatis TaxID=1390249 RepID=A0A1E5L743_9FIRM|nr:YlmC/YmxH family sporulation protein [Desulfuribacillus stibiiarsenatis]OEH85868.1 hypothetical protein BHU72_03565 [Desulfuribacillus stibiiarsenatis]
MRYTNLSTKEIVVIETGEKLGDLQKVDMEIDPMTGQIIRLIIPQFQNFSFQPRKSLHTIPWNQVRIFGEDTVLISIQPAGAKEMSQD